nr:MAG TPA_asm: hypothetical protein [Caudoviricetes sp.]
MISRVSRGADWLPRHARTKYTTSSSDLSSLGLFSFEFQKF